jgi:hypothetical protein
MRIRCPAARHGDEAAGSFLCLQSRPAPVPPKQFPKTHRTSRTISILVYDRVVPRSSRQTDYGNGRAPTSFRAKKRITFSPASSP